MKIGSRKNHYYCWIKKTRIIMLDFACVAEVTLAWGFEIPPSKRYQFLKRYHKQKTEEQDEKTGKKGLKEAANRHKSKSRLMVSNLQEYKGVPLFRFKFRNGHAHR